MKFDFFDSGQCGRFGAFAFWGGHKSITLNYDGWEASACRYVTKFLVFAVWNFASITFNHLKLLKGDFLHFKAISSSNLLKNSKFAKMDHFPYPNKSAISETFGRNFQIRSKVGESTLDLLSKSAKNKISAGTPPLPP